MTLHHPIGETSLIYLSMTERAYAKHYGHILALAYFKKLPKVHIARPIPMSFLWLMMNPEYVCSDNGNASSLHLTYLPTPILCRNTGIVYLAHNRQYVLAANDKSLGINLKRCALWVNVGSKGKCVLRNDYLREEE